VSEQRELLIQQLQDLPPRNFMLKIRGTSVRQGRTVDVTAPDLDPSELTMVEQEYLRRYFTHREHLEEQPAVPFIPSTRADRLVD
jgi:hypothetical protein